ncbi:MAG: hypothetical protein FWD04_09260 [Conexibacteraceae bacterium]|nr:hypothetical protein [Conexibacteraceae bacterium]
MRHAHHLHFRARANVAPVPDDHHPFAPLLARLRASALDRELADGIEPWRTPVHTARALQLASARNRDTLARSLERMVEQAEEPSTPWIGAVVYPSRARVREARPLMWKLASTLHSNAPVAPRGIAALESLLTDGAGPAYSDGDAEALKHELARIERLLAVDS